MKVYGQYYRKLTKLVRTELAEANAVAEEVLGSMLTVKAHAAQARKAPDSCHTLNHLVRATSRRC